jgi:DNA polymerase-3 subunit beta
MKFDVASSELLKKLQIASGSINPNPVLPILEDFLFDLEDNLLTITATNLETSIICHVEVLAQEGGSIAVPAKILLDTLRALPDQPVTFTVNEETSGISLKSSYGEYKLAGDKTDDFPQIPEEDEVNTVVLNNSTILNAISKTIFATSNDELRLSMTGVYVQVDFNKIIFVATDAHKLVKYTFGNISSEITSSFIIPKKGLTLLKNALGDDDEVAMSFNKKNVFFTFGDTKVICRLIDAKYPDYNAVIPVDNPNKLVLGRRDFQNSLKRIAIYANKTTNQVILSLTNASLTISAQDLDFSNEATEQLSCNYEGDPMTIGFNAKFLIEMLGVLESDDIVVELSTPNRAGILLPSEQEEGENLLMLVMPVMMSN